MIGYVAEYRVENNPDWEGPGVETITLPVIVVKRHDDEGPVPCVLGHLGRIHRYDRLHAYEGKPVKLISVRPA